MWKNIRYRKFGKKETKGTGEIFSLLFHFYSKIMYNFYGKITFHKYLLSFELDELRFLFKTKKTSNCLVK